MKKRNTYSLLNHYSRRGFSPLNSNGASTAMEPNNDVDIVNSQYSQIILRRGKNNSRRSFKVRSTSPVSKKFQRRGFYSIVLCILIVAASLLSANKTYASHAMGADLTYTCIGGDTILVRLSFYRDCSGVSAPGIAQINFASISCGQNFTVTANPLPGTGQEVTPLCPSASSTCSGGIFTGIQEWVYEATVVLPAQCDDWVISYTLCCRNGAITNISGPGGNTIYLEANLDNLNYPCNNSPVFSSKPVPFACLGQQFCYNNAAYDPDGDSLVFTMITPLQNATSTVNYLAPFSATQPLTSTPPVAFNSQTGDICMTPTMLEVTVLALQVQEYRNGVLIGTVERDIQLTVLNCSNSLPDFTGINGTGNFADTICADEPYCFFINTFDVDTTQNLTLNWDNAIPAATFTSSAGPRPTGTFCWTPSASDVRNNPYCFSVTVEDDNCAYLGVNTHTFCLTVIGDLQVDLGPDKGLNCNGYAVLNATISGGQGQVNYLWSTGDTVPTITAGPGTYWINVWDTTICQPKTDTIVILNSLDTVSANAGPDISVCSTQLPVNLNGSVVGAIGGEWIGGLGTFLPARDSLSVSYMPSSSEIDSGYVILYLAATDTNLCPMDTDMVRIDIVNYSAIISLSVSNVTCNGGADGSVYLNVSGLGPFTYYWNGSSTAGSDSLTGLTAGNGSVLVVDPAGCDSTYTYSISEPVGMLVACTVDSNVSCNGLNDGVASVSASGGTAPYSYLWSVGSTTSTTNGLTAGTHIVTVTDSIGCSNFCNVVITQPAAIGLIVAINTPISCNGASDGEINAAAWGGTAPYSFVWSDGQTSATAVGLSAGTYAVTISDSRGCTFVSSISLIDPADLNLSLTLNNHITCFGANDGSITASVSGGSGLYSYTWNNGESTATAVNLLPGSATVVVTDMGGCTVSQTIVINEPAHMTASAVLVNSASCSGVSDGAASSSVTGGVAPYTYSWSDGQTTAAVSNMSAGIYTVTISDAGSCTATATVNITQPIILFATMAIDSNISCFGGSDGVARVGIIGGSSPYSFLWSNGTTIATNSALSAGMYTVTITDMNGCTVSRTANLTEPSQIVSTTVGIDNICNGDANGTATVSASAGTAPYSFLWSNGVTGSNISTLSAGSYSAIITDANSCTIVDSVLLSDPAPLNIAANLVSGIDCYGNSNAVLAATASGGTGAINYLWSNSSVNDTVGNVAAGIYTVTVNDSNACTNSIQISVSQPSAMLASSIVDDHVSCFGLRNGAASVTINGGTAPYSYLWSGGQSTSTAAGFAAGTHSVTVTDSNGCIVNTAVAILEPPEISTSVVQNDASCFNNCDGNAEVFPSGGSPPYFFHWSTGASSSAVDSLCAGMYNVMISDTSNCFDTLDIIIAEPAEILDSSALILVTCSGMNNGSINVSLSGGVPGYNYLWNTGSTSSNLTSIAGGTYTLSITDQHSCQKELQFNINEPDPIALTVSNDTLICNGASVDLLASAIGGNSGLGTIVWSDTSLSGAGPHTISPQSNICLQVYAMDTMGCTSPTDSICVNIRAPLNIQIASPDSICPGDTVTLTASTSGGISNDYSIQWSNGAQNVNQITVSPITNPNGAIYTVSLEDACSLPSIDTFIVGFYDKPVSTGTFDDTKGCVPHDVVFANNSGESFFCQWNMGDGTLINSCSAVNHTYTDPGLYDVTFFVQNDDGCRSDISDITTIEVVDNPSANFSANPYVVNTNDPTYQFNNYSSGAVHYIWDFGDGYYSTEFEPNHLYTDSGTYQVTLNVFNADSCKDVYTLMVRVDIGFNMFVPNSFTPNGDGLNEYFFPKYSGKIMPNTYLLQIWNRWGEKIFESYDSHGKWDGSFEGGSYKVQQDVYVYTITLRDMNNNPHRFTGNVTLVH